MANKNQTPEKPKKMEEQIAQLWEACFNHIPSQLHWQNIKLNFIMGFMALVLALMAATIVLLVIP